MRKREIFGEMSWRIRATLESDAQAEGLALGGVKFISGKSRDSEYVDADGGGWAYFMVAASKHSVFSVKDLQLKVEIQSKCCG